jgi:hypothetical protein
MRAESGQSEERWLVSALISPISTLCFPLSRKYFSFVKMNAVGDGVLFTVRDALRNISNNGLLLFTVRDALRNISNNGLPVFSTGAPPTYRRVAEYNINRLTHFHISRSAFFHSLVILPASQKVVFSNKQNKEAAFRLLI